MEEKRLGKEEKRRQLDRLMDWVTSELGQGRVPRTLDVVRQARLEFGFEQLSAAAVAARLRMHPDYHMSYPQQRARSRTDKHRMIAGGNLGSYHCDIGYFSLSREYETPVTFRAGFLIAKDVLSRFTLAVPLKKNKSSKALMAAFDEIAKKHEAAFGPEGHKIVSVSFDLERAVMSREVQQYFADRHIRFHGFKFSSSKAKHAESGIRLFRVTLARLLAGRSDRRWWRYVDVVTDALNSRPLVVRGKRLSYSPKQVNSENLPLFLAELQKKVPQTLFAQFEVDPRVVKFKFRVGDFVRPKTIVVSSAVLGQKRSEVTLSDSVFVIERRSAFVSGGVRLVKNYLCSVLDRPGETESFDEDDLALTNRPK